MSYVDYAFECARGSYDESSSWFKTMILTYNNKTGKDQSYNASLSNPWCAIFVSYCGLITNTSPWITAASCRLWYLYALDKGFHEVSSSDISVGDIIIYDWGSTTGYDHIGIVTGVSNFITVAEGNKSERTGFRYLKASDKSIQHILRPPFLALKGGEDIQVIVSYEGASAIWIRDGLFYSVFNHPDELTYNQIVADATGQSLPSYTFASEAELVRFLAPCKQIN